MCAFYTSSSPSSIGSFPRPSARIHIKRCVVHVDTTVDVCSRRIFSFSALRKRNAYTNSIELKMISSVIKSKTYKYVCLCVVQNFTTHNWFPFFPNSCLHDGFPKNRLIMYFLILYESKQYFFFLDVSMFLFNTISGPLEVASSNKCS